MKVLIVLSAVAACAFAKPTTTVFAGVPLGYAAGPVAYAAAPVAYAAPVAVSSQFHAQDELGQYNYGYSSGLSSKVESKSLDGVTRGGYSYLDAEGKVQNVQYTADAVNGFRVAATNLPVAPVVESVAAPELPKPVIDTPEVAAAKVQHTAAVEEAKARNAAAEVEIVAPVVPQAVPVAPLTHVQPIVTPVAAPAVAAVRYAPGSFSYGYTAAEPIHYTSQFVGAPIAYAAAPVAGYAYSVPSYVNVIPKLEVTKTEEVKA